MSHSKKKKKTKHFPMLLIFLKSTAFLLSSMGSKGQRSNLKNLFAPNTHTHTHHFVTANEPTCCIIVCVNQVFSRLPPQLPNPRKQPPSPKHTQRIIKIKITKMNLNLFVNLWNFLCSLTLLTEFVRVCATFLVLRNKYHLF